MTYDTILVATDGSEPARQAAEQAVAIAKAFDASVTALYVLEAAEPPPWYDDPALEPGIDTKAGQAKDSVVTAAEAGGLESAVTTVVVAGRTGPAIVEYSEEHDVDLIVMGTHGRSGLDRLVLGSVAEHVVRSSPVPVVTVKDD